ncbi:MAG: glycosyltransferase family 9 protein [Ktedonobacterales bacterium]
MFDPLFASSVSFSKSMMEPLLNSEAIERRHHSTQEYSLLDPSSILVNLLLPIGDTLFATPALAALRRQFPWAKVTVLVSRSNAGILTNNPSFDNMVVMDANVTERRMRNLARCIAELRQKRYDLILNLSPVGKLLLMMAGLNQKQLHVDMPPLWWLIGGHSEAYRSRHAVDQYLQVIEPFLSVPLTPEERQPRLYLAAHDRSSARRKLRNWGLSPAHLLITMHVGGDGFNGRKRWATSRFADVANQLIERFNAHILLVGGQEDQPLCQEVVERIPRNITPVAGLTSLRESAALIEMSALFIGNDSCPLHIAAAVGTPAVGIFGPSNPEQFRPMGKSTYRQRLVQSNLPCSPCFHFIGNDAPWVPNTCYSFACLKAITSDEVMKAAMELLQDRRED